MCVHSWFTLWLRTLPIPPGLEEKVGYHPRRESPFQQSSILLSASCSTHTHRAPLCARRCSRHRLGAQGRRQTGLFTSWGLQSHWEQDVIIYYILKINDNKQLQIVTKTIRERKEWRENSWGRCITVHSRGGLGKASLRRKQLCCDLKKRGAEITSEELGKDIPVRRNSEYKSPEAGSIQQVQKQPRGQVWLESSDRKSGGGDEVGKAGPREE